MGSNIVKNIDFRGQKFNKLTILEYAASDIRNSKRVIALCECGKQKEYRLAHIRSGKTLSCGCFRISQINEVLKTHSLSKHPLYVTHRNMKARCYNPSVKEYRLYGARGISICDKWRNSFQVFYDWCIAHGWQQGLQIDRIDNDGNYTPSNCRFVTLKENTNNTRKNVFLTYNGERKTISQWCEFYGYILPKDKAKVWRKIRKKGLSFEKAFSL